MILNPLQWFSLLMLNFFSIFNQWQPFNISLEFFDMTQAIFDSFLAIKEHDKIFYDNPVHLLHSSE